MEDCIFCKIVRKEIPTGFCYENEFVAAFLDINPAAPGHTLVIPKEHYRWFYEVPEEIANEWFKATQNIGESLKEEYAADYVELSIVGKDIQHTHIHLIPRKNIN